MTTLQIVDLQLLNEQDATNDLNSWVKKGYVIDSASAHYNGNITHEQLTFDGGRLIVVLKKNKKQAKKTRYLVSEYLLPVYSDNPNDKKTTEEEEIEIRNDIERIEKRGFEHLISSSYYLFPSKRSCVVLIFKNKKNKKRS